MPHMGHFHLPNEQFGKSPCVKAPVIREIWLAKAAEIIFLKHLSKSLVFDEWIILIIKSGILWYEFMEAIPVLQITFI